MNVGTMKVKMMSKKEERRQSIARQQVFHFPGFTSSSEDDDDDGEEPTVTTQRKPPIKRRMSHDTNSSNKKTKGNKTVEKTATSKPRKQNNNASIRKKLVYQQNPFHSPTEVWTQNKKNATKIHASKNAEAPVEIQDPPKMRRIATPPSEIVITNLPHQISQQDPPEQAFFTPNMHALESPLCQEEEECYYEPAKWSKFRPVSHKQYIIASLILLLAYAVPYFCVDNGTSTVVHKPQGTKNQFWRLTTVPEHDVFSPEALAAGKKAKNCSKPSASSFFPFY